ncbi:ribonucleoside hydrolase 1 [Klebsiella pneumoniae]|uniref:Ribonucleoside hydrolase 1 n=9 Tax=Bacteria TaxID=2 RepID=A0A377WL54_KLEPN|nr:ribonucleoside hydrolase 1 [Klebsiella pneumoniae]
MALPIMIDCDPGHDDAIALVLALASPELEVKAVTASAGNQTPEKTLRNVLRMLTLLNRPDIPVAGGAWKPLMRDLIIADNVHGESGLDGPSLPEPAFAPQNCTAVELMASVLRESQEPVTLVATGPQTNVALLLASHPELHAKIARIVIMGGAMGLGNWQPAAEFNIYVDPQAAEMVFQSGIPVVMAGLDVTHRAQILPADIERFRQIGNPVSTIVAELLDFFMAYHKDEKWGFDGAPAARSLHHRLAPQAGDLYHDRTRVGVETEGKYTQGMTVVDYYHLTGNRPNTTPDAGCGPRSLCRSARPAVSLLRLTSMPGPFSLAEKGPVKSKPARLVVRRDADHYLTEVLTF